VRELRNAQSRTAAGEVGVGAVDRDAPGQLQLASAPSHHELQRLGPARGWRSPVHGVVPFLQLGEGLRLAVPAHVIGAGHGDLRKHRDAPPDHAGVAGIAHAQRAIDALAQQVHEAVAGAKVQFDLRKAREEFGQRRDHHQPRQCRREVHAQPPAWHQRGLAEVGLDLVHVRQQPHAVLVVGLALAGHAHAARGPLQQLRAQPPLQRLDGVRHGGARQREVVGRRRETAQLDDARKQPHGMQAIHC